jgi:mannose-6-phosphate isomerase-like protein (cupin superfamily)
MNGLVLQPDEGRKIVGGGLDIIVKMDAARCAYASTFVVTLGPGYDVGAHVHAAAEELFYIIDGQLDLLAFEPRLRTGSNWQSWTSPDGDQVIRGGPGSVMFVPPGCPHAFSNPGPGSCRVLFQAAPAGHEHYFEELVGVLSQPGPPEAEKIAELRLRYDIEQLTPVVPARAQPG